MPWSITVEKGKIMNEKELTKKQLKQIKKEERKHDRSARKAYRKNHPIGWRLKNIVKNLIKKNR